MSAEREQQGDVIFLFDAGVDKFTTIIAHRSVLSAGSDVFKAIFNDVPQGEGEFIVKGVSKMVFKEFMKYFYPSGEVKLSMEMVFDLLTLGNRYNVQKCIDGCTQFVIRNLTIENVCSVLERAKSKSQTKLIKECEIFIIVNTEAVLKSLNFLACDKDVLAHILKLNMLSVPESSVFETCMAWVKVKSSQTTLTKKIIETYLGDLFYEIRFRSITYSEFCSLVTKYRYALAKDYTTIVEMISRPNLRRFQPGKFNVLRRQFGWNRDAIIKCDRVADSGFERNFDFDDLEETSFLVNKPLILGSFTCCEISSACTKANVKITEIQKCAGSKAKVLMEMQTALKSKGTILLRHPILIRPGIFYIISIEKCSIGQVFYSNELKTKILIATDISIEFHDYSSCQETGKVIGLISALDFNRI